MSLVLEYIIICIIVLSPKVCVPCIRIIIMTRVYFVSLVLEDVLRVCVPCIREYVSLVLESMCPLY